MYTERHGEETIPAQQQETTVAQSHTEGDSGRYLKAKNLGQIAIVQRLYGGVPGTDTDRFMLWIKADHSNEFDLLLKGDLQKCIEERRMEESIVERILRNDETVIDELTEIFKQKQHGTNIH